MIQHNPTHLTHIHTPTHLHAHTPTHPYTHYTPIHLSGVGQGALGTLARGAQTTQGTIIASQVNAVLLLELLRTDEHSR